MAMQSEITCIISIKEKIGTQNEFTNKGKILPFGLICAFDSPDYSLGVIRLCEPDSNEPLCRF